MAFALSARSRKSLIGVHPDLIKVFERAILITSIDFILLEGVRTLATQKKYVANGASRTMKSRHLPSKITGFGCALDAAPYVSGKVSWHWPHYSILAPAIKQAARDVDVPIEWGGDWRSFKDGPHWQLPWRLYP